MTSPRWIIYKSIFLQHCDCNVAMFVRYTAFITVVYCRQESTRILYASNPLWLFKINDKHLEATKRSITSSLAVVLLIIVAIQAPCFHVQRLATLLMVTSCMYLFFFSVTRLYWNWMNGMFWNWTLFL